ncbi:MAG: DUF1524 domain-containing protein, partial [Candidatus Dadabacteria bacterium]|nr:DUF1524 domain-containing protein [Candidatus Dadabacteria bacterium]
KERVHIQDYTIEHIMQQHEEKSKQGEQELGDDWKSIHNQYLHTLGNLTLTGYNSEYSDHPFSQKRDMEGGFKQSPLKLNERLRDCKEWNEKSIQARAEYLSKEAIEIWKYPTISNDILECYRDQKEETTTDYTITDHQHLSSGFTRDLFDALRKEVCALDDCVREEFLKLYVAYKAETNFVDVVPQSKRLLLILNMDFTAIDDPRGICKDVTSVGRWGNGNVEVGLESKEDLPYIMGLVRQALEKQMGEEGEDE